MASSASFAAAALKGTHPGPIWGPAAHPPSRSALRRTSKSAVACAASEGGSGACEPRVRIPVKRSLARPFISLTPASRGGVPTRNAGPGASRQGGVAGWGHPRAMQVSGKLKGEPETV